MVPKDDNMNMTKKSMIASIDVAMGGRAAEDLFVGNNEV
jgi:ATP-dependent metalloprotease